MHTLDEWCLPAEIERREDFGVLLNAYGLLGAAVEIGTHLGEFAEQILDVWEGGPLVCVDPWITNLAGYDGQQLNGRDRDADYEVARVRLARFGDRVAFKRMLSEEAVGDFAPDSLDFVYLDGNHQPAYIRADLELWYDRLKPGGVLAGHDINGDWCWSIAPAVYEFSQKHGLRVYFMLGDAASYYLFKPKAD